MNFHQLARVSKDAYNIISRDVFIFFCENFLRNGEYRESASCLLAGESPRYGQPGHARCVRDTTASVYDLTAALPIRNPAPFVAVIEGFASRATPALRAFLNLPALQDFTASCRIFTLASDDEMDKIAHVGPKPAIHPFVGDQIVGPDNPLTRKIQLPDEGVCKDTRMNPTPSLENLERLGYNRGNVAWARGIAMRKPPVHGVDPGRFQILRGRNLGGIQANIENPEKEEFLGVGSILEELFRARKIVQRTTVFASSHHSLRLVERQTSEHSEKCHKNFASNNVAPFAFVCFLHDSTTAM
ncbi:hypothetical protein DFH08DRAFT_825893 [Mycena albidolilacea]|uniref:Uncharacterized protein n=1 Tax=Mycena albidolilacea TaxID=1033008 RepID=A0AAD6Z279_9AGAR|nr:hypothetical protein DFH08DRAFT_825893 [Mycena albidolilacea]